MDLVRTLGFALSALSSCAAFGLKIAHCRRSWDELAYRVLVLVLLLQCVTFSMGVVALTTDRLLGVGNLAILAMHLAAVAYCVSAEVLLLLWTSTLAQARPRVVRWIAFGAIVEVVLVTLFVVARIDRLPAVELNTGSGRPLVILYLLVFMLSQALPCFTIVRQCVPYSRLAGAGWLRTALRVLAVSALLLFGYCLSRIAIILISIGGFDVGTWAITPALFSALGIVTLNVGLTAQSWGPRVGDLRRWCHDYAAYRDLYPLWYALYQASPGISLEPPGRSLADLSYRLHRRVIEIRDGWRALGPYMDEPGGEPSAETSETAMASGEAASAGGKSAMLGREAVASEAVASEAARVRAALLAKRAGHAPRFAGAAPSPRQKPDTLDAEVRWLRQVSRTFVQLGGDRPGGEGET